MDGITEDHTRILDHYQRMRSASRELNNTLMDRCKPPVKQAAKDLGVLVKDTIVLDMDQMPVLMDYAIHHCRKDGRNVVDRFAATNPPEHGSDAEAVLTAMQQAFFSLFVVRDVVEGVGVHVTDILRDAEHFIADVGFSETAVEGLVLASRVLPFDEFVMTTGAALPVDAEVLEWVASGLEQAVLSHEQLRNLPPQAWADLEARVVHACLHSDGDQQITYQDVPSSTGPSPFEVNPTASGATTHAHAGAGRSTRSAAAGNWSGCDEVGALGHYCWVCGRCRANEKFSGKGHARHICKDCARLPREDRDRA